MPGCVSVGHRSGVADRTLARRTGLVVAVEGLRAEARLRLVSRCAGLLRGDGWLCVVGGRVEENDLDSDPSVIAYCEAP